MNNDERDHDFVRRQLRTAIPPWQDHELTTDLWPRMLSRMAEAPAGFGWFEYLLVSLIVVSLAVFPNLIPMMLYHL